ncbi:RusA family crossover junction endodeoxyribonuclease [Yersinia ruckeri]|uniref:RusA family crossover junction endodeoxyribonuclease n=2 Tax=Yersinia ruckeri TaxID=29486 RepID=UPI00200A56D2|nr:RusA family crossover junction endodeoxyribonuclease [Yersinia ruckeri]MCK8575345.1 RusA family crossover junction endodeoxyribonuclease [Yersinia ruckeri]MCW6601754.1 RusA family crossover junction endodeoxyribonuclease [Yersinia ruckeri]MCW6606861.1 RusA family crossover junction endodeoxyribonuclease [Yersinia ruckeri]UZX57536.1 RusA family crossover junction endodeoxyribonuclease [Yersinia ruckeri]UZX95865.1 RusA family crossover junction endodeoxyribonuclease [Yersinia ruckeri]
MLLTLPFPPSVNSYWRAPSKGPLAGRHLISAKGRQFRTEALACVLEQLRRVPKIITEPVSVTIVFYPPNLIRRDLDNFLKAPLDALTHAGVWADDSQVKKLTMEWGPVTKGGKVDIQIRERQNAG